MSPEQRELLRETQLVMSLLEGFSDWVMDEVGAEVLPNVPASASASRRAATSAGGRSTGSSPGSPAST